MFHVKQFPTTPKTRRFQEPTDNSPNVPHRIFSGRGKEWWHHIFAASRPIDFRVHGLNDTPLTPRQRPGWVNLLITRELGSDISHKYVDNHTLCLQKCCRLNEWYMRTNSVVLTESKSLCRLGCCRVGRWGWRRLPGSIAWRRGRELGDGVAGCDGLGGELALGSFARGEQSASLAQTQEAITLAGLDVIGSFPAPTSFPHLGLLSCLNRARRRR